MRFRRVLGASMAGGAVVAAGLVGAGPSSAATLTPIGTFSCSVASTPTESRTGYVGDTFTVYGNGTCDLTSSSAGVVSWTGSLTPGSDPAQTTNETITISLDTVGTTTYRLTWPNYPTSGGQLTITVTVQAAPSPSTHEVVSGPAPWWQSYARGAEDEVCSEGWAASWAVWPNAGTGGWVCNQELVYHAATSTWAAR